MIDCLVRTFTTHSHFYLAADWSTERSPILPHSLITASPHESTFTENYCWLSSRAETQINFAIPFTGVTGHSCAKRLVCCKVIENGSASILYLVYIPYCDINIGKLVTLKPLILPSLTSQSRWRLFLLVPGDQTSKFPGTNHWSQTCWAKHASALLSSWTMEENWVLLSALAQGPHISQPNN